MSSESSVKDIYEHTCARCEGSLSSTRVVLGDNSDHNNNNVHDDSSPTTEREKDTRQYVCEPCFEREKRAFYRAMRERKPLVPQRCDLCGRGPRSRFLKDLACHVCDTCQDENDRSDEEIMSSMYTLDVQREKFELPDEIIPDKLFLGSKNSSTNDEVLINGLNIAQIIVCCGHLPAHFRENQNISPSIAEKITTTEGESSSSSSMAPPPHKYAIRFLRLPIRDDLEQDLLPFLESAFEFINQGHERHNCATLVHCHAGVSRSAAVVIAWLMRHRDMDYETAHRFVKEKRKVICPNSNFVEQLKSLSTNV